MPDSNPETDAGPASDPCHPADISPAPEGESGPCDRPAPLAATPDADAVSDRVRTLALLAAVLGLLVTLIAAELLVRI